MLKKQKLEMRWVCLPGDLGTRVKENIPNGDMGRKQRKGDVTRRDLKI